MPSSAMRKPPENLILRISSPERDVNFKALRELKNQIIGNRTKKLSYVKIAAVPAVVSALSAAVDSGDVASIIEASTVIGSFSCGIDAGVKAVLDAGAFVVLFRLISHSDLKVVDAAARSLKMIYQSKLAPKYDFLQKENMNFLLSLLNTESENLTGLGASIIAHSCESNVEKKALCEAGVLQQLLDLLGGSLNQRDAGLESIGAMIRNDPDVSSEFVKADGGEALKVVTELTKDRHPRTRLLASMCLISMWNASPFYSHDDALKKKLILVLLELLDDPGQVGDEAPFALSSLIAGKENLQKLAFETDVIDKLNNHLTKAPLLPKRVQGLLLALADVCSKLEVCRLRFISLEGVKLISEALSHESSDVRVAACICLRSVSRSVKSLTAGLFMNEPIVMPLVRLLNDASTFIQVAALTAISNVVVEFTTRKSTFVQCGGIKQLVHLSTSMNSTVRSNAVRALKNLIFLADNQCKEGIFMELTPSTLSSLICDPEPSVQEQALLFVRNLVDGCIDAIEFVFIEEGIVFQSVGRQLRNASKSEICIQAMYVLCNVATGNDVHKNAVLQELIPVPGSDDQCILNTFLRSNDDSLRTAAVWAVVNLTFPSSSNTYARYAKLRSAGVIDQLNNMANDPCLDVQLRVKTALKQSLPYVDGSM